jgi:hypothetical protein
MQTQASSIRSWVSAAALPLAWPSSVTLLTTFSCHSDLPSLKNFQQSFSTTIPESSRLYALASRHPLSFTKRCEGND